MKNLIFISISPGKPIFRIFTLKKACSPPISSENVTQHAKYLSIVQWSVSRGKNQFIVIAGRRHFRGRHSTKVKVILIGPFLYEVVFFCICRFYFTITHISIACFSSAKPGESHSTTPFPKPHKHNGMISITTVILKQADITASSIICYIHELTKDGNTNCSLNRQVRQSRLVSPKYSGKKNLNWVCRRGKT